MIESRVVVNAYILHAFMGVIVLLLIALLGAVFRMLFIMGGLQSEISALWRAIGEVRQEIAGVRQEITELREQMSQLRERVAENRGLLLNVHQRIDLLMRHRTMMTPATW